MIKQNIMKVRENYPNRLKGIVKILNSLLLIFIFIMLGSFIILSIQYPHNFLIFLVGTICVSFGAYITVWWFKIILKAATKVK